MPVRKRKETEKLLSQASIVDDIRCGNTAGSGALRGHARHSHPLPADIDTPHIVDTLLAGVQCCVAA